jgi:hypothetical protein
MVGARSVVLAEHPQSCLAKPNTMLLVQQMVQGTDRNPNKMLLDKLSR